MNEDEIDTLNRLVTLFLDTAELRVKDQNELSLDFWKAEVDGIIAFSRKKILSNLGKISQDEAKNFTQKQYQIFDDNRKRLEAKEIDDDEEEILNELIKKTKKNNEFENNST